MIARRCQAALASILAVGSLLASAALVSAEHEPSHRYFLAGTVTNDRGEPLCGITVRAAALSAPDSPDRSRSTTTDRLGGYLIQLHIHDSFASVPSNEGDTIRVSVDGTDVFRDVLATPNGRNPDGWGEQEVSLTVSGMLGCGRVAPVAAPGPALLVVPVIAGVGAASAVVGILAWKSRKPPRAF